MRVTARCFGDGLKRQLLTRGFRADQAGQELGLLQVSIDQSYDDIDTL